MRISTTEARGLFTQYLIDVYKERIAPTNYFRSYFPTVESTSKLISIEVQRMGEIIAVDVLRGTDGNRNTFSRSTQKLFEPPYFREWFELTDIDLYDRLNGADSIDDAVFAELITNVADKLSAIQEKIERTYELMCAQALHTGIITLNANTDIDYKRKSASIVDPGSYWATADVDPFAQFEAGGDFLRKTGKMGGVIINATLGATAMAHLKKNNVFLARQDTVNMKLDDVTIPQMRETGASYHGMVSAGSYLVRLFSYPQFYDHPETGVQTPYMNPKQVIMTPEKPKFKLSFAAVPQLLNPGSTPAKGAYKFGEFRDEWNGVHKMDVKSAGVPVLTAVDQVYTFKAVSGSL